MFILEISHSTNPRIYHAGDTPNEIKAFLNEVLNEGELSIDECLEEIARDLHSYKTFDSLQELKESLDRPKYLTTLEKTFVKLFLNENT